MNKRVVITGGSRGIGAALVRKFSLNGDYVAFIYKSSDIDADILKKKFNAIPVKCDVSKEQEAEKGIEEAICAIGGADVLINNAGISKEGLLSDTSEDEYRLIMDTNFGGTYRCSKAVIPKMVRNQKGCIINIASIWGEVGASMEVLYSASKAAIIGMTKALSKELAPSGINVNCISPGMIDTEMNSIYSKDEIKDFINDIPLGRIGNIDDIAEAALFLSSEKASYITGQVISINGGIVV